MRLFLILTTAVAVIANTVLGMATLVWGPYRSLAGVNAAVVLAMVWALGYWLEQLERATGMPTGEPGI